VGILNIGVGTSVLVMLSDDACLPCYTFESDGKSCKGTCDVGCAYSCKGNLGAEIEDPKVNEYASGISEVGLEVWDPGVGEWVTQPDVWSHIAWEEESIKGYLSYPIESGRTVRIYVKDRAGNKTQPYPIQY